MASAKIVVCESHKLVLEHEEVGAQCQELHVDKEAVSSCPTVIAASISGSMSPDESRASAPDSGTYVTLAIVKGQPMKRDIAVYEIDML